MKTLQDIRNVLQEHRRELNERFGVSRVAVFGSHARGEPSPSSDIDIMVEFERPVGWEFWDLRERLEAVLQMKVDLATPAMLEGKPRLWETVKKDLQYV